MKYCQLTRDERSQIYALKSNGHTLTEIAAYLRRAVSTISREIKRNSGGRGYQYKQANELAVQRRVDANSGPQKMYPRIIWMIERLIRRNWSPEQVSGRLKFYGINISYESIYLYIWRDRKLNGTLYKHLRRKGKKYNHRSVSKAGRGCIPHRVDIRERPTIVEDKLRIGDWEGDTIIGSKHKGAILTHVDRHSKYTKMILLKDKTTVQVLKGTRWCFRNIPRKKLKTITYDNGKEFACHEKVTEETGLKCYFATPYHSWERGLNEHTNGLIRQYFPKGTDFTTLTRKEIHKVETALNNRPRKVLGYKTPKEVFLNIKPPKRLALQG